MAREQTVAIIKPDAVASQDIGKVFSAAEAARLGIVAIRMFTFSEELACKFYGEHENKSFFADLIRFTCSGPCVAMVLEGDDAIARWRTIIGHTNPHRAEPHTLRARLGTCGPRNAVHGSSDGTAVETEIGLLGLRM